MYSVNFVSDRRWEVFGELTATEYHALMRAIRAGKFEHLVVIFSGRQAGRAVFRKVRGETLCCNITKDTTHYVHSYVVLARLAATPEEKTQRLEDAKKWVAEHGYGYRFRV